MKDPERELDKRIIGAIRGAAWAYAESKTDNFRVQREYQRLWLEAHITALEAALRHAVVQREKGDNPEAPAFETLFVPTYQTQFEETLLFSVKESEELEEYEEDEPEEPGS